MQLLFALRQTFFDPGGRNAIDADDFGGLVGPGHDLNLAGINIQHFGQEVDQLGIGTPFGGIRSGES